VSNHLASHDALVPYGWDARVATLAATALARSLATVDEDPHRTLFPARVVRVDRDRVAVATPHGIVTAHGDPLPAVGDWILVREAVDHDLPAVASVLPRRTELTRADPHTGTQTLAANVDVVAICHPLDRPPNPNRVERELVVAWEGGAIPVVVLTKADALDDPAAVADTLRARLAGVDVIVTSATTGEGIDKLLALVRPTGTLALIGPSGAGKSSLANRLLGTATLEVGDVRAGDHRGRHTTTARHLLPIPHGGVLVDTPGLRALGLTGGEDGILAAFPDIEALAAECRFRDCAHAQEPDCAVQGAVADGSLDPDRLASWIKLSREAAHVRRTEDDAARAAREAEVRRVHREMRRRPPRAR